MTGNAPNALQFQADFRKIILEILRALFLFNAYLHIGGIAPGALSAMLN
jgi:hypothetical protein